MSKVKSIFVHTDCLSKEVLEKYLFNKLASVEKHEAEKHLIDCEMCSDALEGLSMIADKKKISSITTELNEKIQKRIEKKEVRVIFLRGYRTQLAIAASIVVILGMIWFFRNNVSVNELNNTSSEKIFADKLDPLQTKSVPQNNIPEGNPEMLDKSKDKAPGVSSAEATKKLSKSKFFDKEEHFSPVINVNSVPTPAGSKTEAFAKGASANDKVIGTPVPQSPQESAPPPSNSTSAHEKVQLAMQQGKKNGNRSMKQEEEGKLSEEVISMKPESNAEKKRSKTKMAQPEMNSAPVASPDADVTAEQGAEAIVSDSIATGTTPNTAHFAMEKYEKKNYSGAIEEFEKILAKDPDNYNALFYSSVSYLSTGQADKAITNLNKILEKKDGEFYDAAQWYLSLAYIKKKDSLNARKVLMEVQKNFKSKYQKQADETLKKMNK